MSELRDSSKDRKPAPGWLTIQRGYLMQAASIIGMFLVVLEIVSLSYFASPLRLLLQAVEQQDSDPIIPILGGLALIGGIALLFVASANRPDRLFTSTESTHRSTQWRKR